MSEQGPNPPSARKGMFEVLTYIWEYQTYADTLRTDSQHLKARLTDVQKKVEDARSNGQGIKQQVLRWLDDGNQEVSLTDTFLGSLHPQASCCNFARKCNCKCRYRLAKRAESHSEQIKLLMERGSFEGVSLELKPSPVMPQPLTPTMPSGYISLPSREKYLTRTMEALLSTDMFVIGMYGAKDVGKTMLVRKLVLAIESTGVFNGVAIMTGDWVDAQLAYMQVELAQKLGLSLTLESAGKAKSLSNKITNMGKVLIIVDNLERKIDLNNIGIPSLNNSNGCRILVVSRSLDVCKEMKTQMNLEIEHLCQQEALHLFDEVAKEFSFTDTTLIQQAREEGMQSKFLWTPGEIKTLINSSHNKLLLPTKSIVSIGASAKKTLMLGAEALTMWHAFKPQYWRWLAPSPSTSSLKVGELIIVWGLHIEVSVREEWLSPATNYGTYFVYQLTCRARGFSNTLMETTVGNTIKSCYLDPSTASSKMVEGGGAMPKRRKDGWLEIEMGSFFNVGHSGAVVDLLVKEYRSAKSGLLVQGFEMRPLD